MPFRPSVSLQTFNFQNLDSLDCSMGVIEMRFKDHQTHLQRLLGFKPQIWVLLARLLQNDSLLLLVFGWVPHVSVDGDFGTASHQKVKPDVDADAQRSKLRLWFYARVLRVPVLLLSQLYLHFCLPAQEASTIALQRLRQHKVTLILKIIVNEWYKYVYSWLVNLIIK